MQKARKISIILLNMSTPKEMVVIMSKTESCKRTNYILKERDAMTDVDREMLRAFLEKFESAKISPVELRLPAEKIREFLKDYNMTFTKFNRMAACLGRTTGNLYAYDTATIQSLVDPAKFIEGSYRRKFQSDRIKTIDYYGSKRSWRKEFHILFEYAADNLGCNRFVDCFAGSAFLSLLASKIGKFSFIQANEASPTTYNFHRVMQGKETFERFIGRLERLPHINGDSFKSIRESQNHGKTPEESSKREDREGHERMQSVDVEAALSHYVIQHYAYNCQGGRSNSRVPVSFHVNALKGTHTLYQKLELTNFYYKKILLPALEDEHTLICLDPPYLTSVRAQTKSYEKEFSERQHRTMIQLLSKQKYPSKIILCGYRKGDKPDLYSRYLMRSEAEWHCYHLLRGSELSGDRAFEHVWTNFDLTDLLAAHEGMFEQIF